MIRKKPIVQALTALALLTATAALPAAEDQPAGGYGPGYGMHPGMMGGYGMGQGMMGPGMMGMGPGMMGHGMMMPPGMMNDGCTGMGMMGMGAGMMGGYGPWGALNLSEAQQKKIVQTQNDLRKKHWDLMGKMNDEYAKLNEFYYSEPRDPAVIGKQYQRISDLRRQMMESSVDAQNRIEATLTPEQKQQLRGYGRGGMMW